MKLYDPETESAWGGNRFGYRFGFPSLYSPLDKVYRADHSSRAMTKPKTQSLIPLKRVASRIYLIRGMKVIFDFDLAELYAVETKALNQAVSRNLDRFPGDFMFTLTNQEITTLRSQIVTSNWGGRRYLPRVFTQEGVAMLSGVLRGKRAVEVNVSIMRAFVRLRELLATNAELARKVGQHDRQIAVLFEHVRSMLAPVPVKKNPIGFIHPKD